MILFGIFASAFSGLDFASKLWPAALILLGLIVLLMGFRKKKVEQIRLRQDQSSVTETVTHTGFG